MRCRLIHENLRSAALSELIVESDLVRRGFNVLRPLVVSRYDLMADDGRRFYRVQCKTGRYDMRGSSPTLKVSFETPYDPSEVDVIAVVDQDAEVVYYVPTSDLTPGTLGLTIRFDKASRETSAFDAGECIDWPFGETKEGDES